MALSNRGQANFDMVSGALPKTPRHPEQDRKPEPKYAQPIDLSGSENWLIREELIDISKRSISQDLREEHLSYPPPLAGDPSLINALASFFNKSFNPVFQVEPKHIVIGAGASGILDALFYNVCNPGDGILLPGPYWNGLDMGLRIRASVEPVLVELPDFQSNFTDALINALEAAVERSTIPIRGLLLCNPHNPLAVCYPKAVLEKCVQFCVAHNIHFICDEVYATTEFEAHDLKNPVPFTSSLSLDLDKLGGSSLVHTVWSTSKDFGQSGFRLGCVVNRSNPELTLALSLACYPNVSQLTAIAVRGLLQSAELPKLKETNSRRLSENYQLITTNLQRLGLPYIPCNAGLYIWAKIAPQASTWDDEQAAVGKLREHGVVVGAGRKFHSPESEKGWSRILFSVEKPILEEAIRRMETALKSNST